MNLILNPFEELLVGLAKSEIKFIVVGGLACAFNGYVRATEDVDILIQKNKENIQKLLQFLSAYGEGFGSELQESDFQDEEGAIRVIESFPIDIFTLMGGNHYEDLEKMSKTIEIQEVKIQYLGEEGLILLKKNSVREKDRLDVIQLSILKKEKK